MKNCYWIVKTNNPDIDKIIYISGAYQIDEIINFENETWRIIDIEII